MPPTHSVVALVDEPEGARYGGPGRDKGAPPRDADEVGMRLLFVSRRSVALARETSFMSIPATISSTANDLM